jgi:hypothetical protein
MSSEQRPGERSRNKRDRLIVNAMIGVLLLANAGTLARPYYEHYTQEPPDDGRVFCEAGNWPSEPLMWFASNYRREVGRPPEDPQAMWLEKRVPFGVEPRLVIGEASCDIVRDAVDALTEAGITAEQYWDGGIKILPGGNILVREDGTVLQMPSVETG